MIEIGNEDVRFGIVYFESLAIYSMESWNNHIRREYTISSRRMETGIYTSRNGIGILQIEFSEFAISVEESTSCLTSYIEKRKMRILIAIDVTVHTLVVD